MATEALNAMIAAMQRYLRSAGMTHSELARVTAVPVEPTSHPKQQVSVAQLQQLWHLIQDKLTASLQFSRQVRPLIECQLARGKVRVATVAAQLNMSRYTLYKRLKEENQTFAGLLEDVRRAQALVYLQERQRPLSEIAELLGFSELSAFSRAFKRWVGMSPAVYRQTCLQ